MAHKSYYLELKYQKGIDLSTHYLTTNMKENNVNKSYNYKEHNLNHKDSISGLKIFLKYKLIHR